MVNWIEVTRVSFSTRYVLTHFAATKEKMGFGVYKCVFPPIRVLFRAQNKFGGTAKTQIRSWFWSLFKKEFGWCCVLPVWKNKTTKWVKDLIRPSSWKPNEVIIIISALRFFLISASTSASGCQDKLFNRFWLVIPDFHCSSLLFGCETSTDSVLEYYTIFTPNKSSATTLRLRNFLSDTHRQIRWNNWESFQN